MAHLRFQTSALPHCYRLEQVVFRVDMASGLVSGVPIGLVDVHLVLATGPGNLPAVRVRTRNKVWFGSITMQRPNPLLPSGPNPAPYLSTSGFCQVWLDPSGPISGFAFRVVPLMFAFRYLTLNRKILTMVHECSFWMNWPPL